MIERPARRRALGAVLAASLVLAACGGSDAATEDTETDAAGEATTTTAETVEETTTSEAVAEEAAAETTVETAVASEPVRPEVVATPQSAGPLTVTPTHCTVEGYDFMNDDDGPASLAFAGERLFVATSAGIVAFTVDTDAGCVLTLDTSIGDQGVLHPDSFDSLSGNAAGRLVAGNVFGMTVFDIEPGYSYECDGPNGQVTLSDDGTTAVGNFATGPAERWTLNDTICTFDVELAFPDLADVKWVEFVGDDLFVGGEGLDEVRYITRYAAAGSGAELWRAGTGDMGAPGWFGWIHGVAPCGPYTCVVDTNTKQFAVIDAGTIVAAFDTPDLFGLNTWITPIVQAPDGSNFTLLTPVYDDEATGERTHFGEIFRVEVTVG